MSLQLPSSGTGAAAAASGLSQGLPVLPDLENINGLAPLVKQFLNVGLLRATTFLKYDRLSCLGGCTWVRSAH